MPTETDNRPVEIPEGPATPQMPADIPTPGTPARATRNTPVVPPAPKARKTPAPKPRNMNELHTLDPKKMTDAEKNIVIAEYREAIEGLGNRCMAFEENAKSAYELYRQSNDKYNALTAKINDDMAFIIQTAEQAARVIKTIGGAK